MSRRSLFLLGLLLTSSLVPFVSGTAPALINMEYRVQGKGEAVPNQGYWFYGEFWNKGFLGKREVVVEVTLYDEQGGVIDVLSTMVSPTIIEVGQKAGFIVKSTTTTPVAEEKVKLKSYKETENLNYQYIEVSAITSRSTGVGGVLTNTHAFIYVFEAEVIATFYDAEDNVVDVQSWGAASYEQFDPQVSEQFFIETSKEYETYTLSTQCNRASRHPYMSLKVERPSSSGTWTPPIGETIVLVLNENPWHGAEYVDVTITNPNGESSIQQFTLTENRDFRYEITPDIAGRWNVTCNRDAYLVNNSVILVEPLSHKSGFFVHDPDAEVEQTEPDEVTNSTESEDDSLTSKAQEIVENIPEEVKQNIPGFHTYSIIAALLVTYLLFSRKNNPKAYLI